MNKPQIKVVCAIIKDGEKVLCTQRLRKGLDYISEHWEFPGGKVEADESKQEALQREILEEMDWKIQVGPQLAEMEYEYPDFFIQLTAYSCTAHDKNFKLLAHIDACWLKPDNFPQLNWAAADAELIKLIW